MTPRLRRRVPGAILLLLLVVAAVTVATAWERDDDAVGALTSDPCRIFTKAEVREHFNMPPQTDAPARRYLDRWTGPIPPLNVVGMEFCWVGTGPGAQHRAVYVGLTTALAREAFAKWGEAITAQESTKTTQVGGLGTRALFVTGNPAVATPYAQDALVVLTGDKLLSITSSGRSHALERSRKLATIGLERL